MVPGEECSRQREQQKMEDGEEGALGLTSLHLRFRICMTRLTAVPADHRAGVGSEGERRCPGHLLSPSLGA